MMATPRIIGGQPATANAYPFALALSLRRGFICGASLVSLTWALTAAHCVTLSSWEPVSRYVVGVRRHDISIASGADGDCAEEIEVAEIQRHPRYDAVTMLNDICLLRLSRPPRCPASYVTLDVSGAASGAGTLARVIGWGDQTASSYDYEAYTVLREVDVPLLGNAKCAQWLSNGGFGDDLYDSMICASDRDGGRRRGRLLRRFRRSSLRPARHPGWHNLLGLQVRVRRLPGSVHARVSARAMGPSHHVCRPLRRRCLPDRHPRLREGVEDVECRAL